MLHAAFGSRRHLLLSTFVPATARGEMHGARGKGHGGKRRGEKKRGATGLDIAPTTVGVPVIA
jgi:hypothetical protein